jgi:hypothetical protein
MAALVKSERASAAVTTMATTRRFNMTCALHDYRLTKIVSKYLGRCAIVCVHEKGTSVMTALSSLEEIIERVCVTQAKKTTVDLTPK